MNMLMRAAAAAACLASVASCEHIQYKIRNRQLASRAANLGGWLLSEYWMCYTSVLYKNVTEEVGYGGEYAVMKFLGKEQGDKQFEDHWETWITEDDVAKIAKTGLNTIRVSTGFWIIQDEDKNDTSEITNTYPSGGLKHLDTLINDWAVKYNLAVMVSLHAHRGSQNGYDHSAPVELGNATWSDDPANVQSSLKYATFIAHRYKHSDAFLGLNLMNEPNYPLDYPTLKQYYKDAYQKIRDDGNDCIIVTSPFLVHQGPGEFDDFMTCPDYYNVWHEWHIYYRWGWEGVSKKDVLAAAKNYSISHLKSWTGNPIFLGEWSLTTTDDFNLTLAELKGYSKSQMREAEKAPAGWAFWAWRHDEETKKDPSGWSLRQLLNESIIDIPTDAPLRKRNATCKAPFSHSASWNGTDVEVPDSEITYDDYLNATSSSSGVDVGDESGDGPGTVGPSEGSPKAQTSSSRPLSFASAAVLAVVSTSLAWAAL